MLAMRQQLLRLRCSSLPLCQDWPFLLTGLLAGKWVKLGLCEKASQPTSTCDSCATLLLRQRRGACCLDRHLAW
jgi:hypothetical protein